MQELLLKSTVRLNYHFKQQLRCRNY